MPLFLPDPKKVYYSNNSLNNDPVRSYPANKNRSFRAVDDGVAGNWSAGADRNRQYFYYWSNDVDCDDSPKRSGKYKTMNPSYYCSGDDFAPARNNHHYSSFDFPVAGQRPYDCHWRSCSYSAPLTEATSTSNRHCSTDAPDDDDVQPANLNTFI